MESVQAPITVMQRYEWKYILSAEQTAFFCERLKGHMEPDAYGLTTISTLYYDTADRKLIRASIEKPTFKEKIRLRAYSPATYRIAETTVYVADVVLSSSDYLKTAFAESTYGRNVTETTSSIASPVDAILAINGDYYGAQRSGYVIRNGVLYRNTSGGGEDLVIYADGSFGIVDENEVTAEELLASGAWNVRSFGPALVQDGAITVSENDEVGRAMASNPRTAIGVIDDLHYVFVVADGRTSASDGLSLYELAAFMQSLGVKTAYNLDGGGSS